MSGYLQSFPAEFIISGVSHCAGEEKLSNEDVLKRFNLRMRPSFIEKKYRH